MENTTGLDCDLHEKSNCCGAVFTFSDICSDCGEHASPSCSDCDDYELCVNENKSNDF